MNRQKEARQHRPGDLDCVLGRTQNKNSTIIPFPHYRRRSLFTLSERCHAWRSIRVPRGDYLTPMPEDLREVRR